MHSRVVTVPAVPLHMNNISKANNISSRQLKKKLEIIIKIEFNFVLLLLVSPYVTQ